jgi:hypothetical protein
VKVTGWNKKIPMEPVVEDTTDAEVSNTPEATAALNNRSVLVHLVELKDHRRAPLYAPTRRAQPGGAAGMIRAMP